MLGGRRDVGVMGGQASWWHCSAPLWVQLFVLKLPSPSQMEEALGHGGLLPEHRTAPGHPAVLCPPQTLSAPPAVHHAAGCAPGRDLVLFPWADPNADLNPAPATFLI